MNIELDIITDIYSPPDKRGVVRLIKKNLVYKKWFDKDKIFPEEFINKRGQIIKKYTTIEYEGKYYTLNYSRDKVHELIGPIEVKGLAAKSKSYGKGNTKNKRI